ncbi:FAD-dependent oxidoreductase [Hydrogenophaga sp.]|uniref:FAD-dependent oxidoreductase n=1 Tax=Hydrogenophaga sp. TaxID=1904254 RepID=UPI00272693AF|nr:FAD-dependent oxidoreductase [Hydrogenophaga sp.]MDO9437819.1 FAD-dependent oxidoreductase [Hydrogenophaga sp.]
MVEDVSVLIVGGGPVGLALAGELGWRGVKSMLIEKSGGIPPQPRMDLVGIRSMEFCRRWGIVDWVENSGYNRDYPQDNIWVTHLNGYEFGREFFPTPANEKSPPYSPQHRERCPQNFFDPVLARFAGHTGLSELQYNCAFKSFEDHGDHIIATVQDTRSGAERQIRARYLVGCDGGSSTVRNALNLSMEGDGVLTYSYNVIFRCDGLEKLHKIRPGYRFVFIGPEGGWAVMVAANGRDQWRFSFVGDREKREYPEAEVRKAIVRAVGREFDFEVLSVLPWTRRQLVAKQYRKGNAFIAGDAAHVTSPTGGFGMNTGILDIVNLGWKLAAVVQGWGGEHLLDSYELEQHPVAVRNVTEAGEDLRRLLSTRTNRLDPRAYEDNTPEFDEARKAFGDAYTQMMKREWFTPGVHLGYVYEHSPIIVPDGTPAPRNQLAHYDQTARPGSRAPHVWLEPGHSTLDLFGRKFVLLRFGAVPTPVQALVDAAARVGMPLQVVDLDNAEAEKLYENKLVLVRPDGSVAWRADAVPEDAQHIVDTLRGAIDPSPHHLERREYVLAEH